MSNIAIRAQNISKLYHLGRAINPNDTLRDAVQGAIRRLRAGPRKGDASNQDELLWALKDITFDIAHGEVFGLIGLNGAGKSTLLKILSRITRPTTGRVEIHGRVGSLLEVGTGFHPDLTGRENIFLNGAILGMKKKEIERKFDEIVAFSEMERFLDTQVKRYSSGMYVRLAFAVAAHLEPEVLLVDEVLAVGDAAFQKKCFGKVSDVAQSGRTVILVSHNMAAVELLCNKGIVLKSGKIVYTGQAEQAVRFYEEVIVTDARKEKDILPGHILYQKPPQDPRKNFEITRIELLTLDGQPKDRLYTWDPVRVRFHYHTSQPIASGAVEVRISTRHGVPLVYTSNQPDDYVPMSFSARDSFTDLIIDQFPLSAGDYILGAGLSVPNREWLCWNDALGVLTVEPRDVFKSGSAPVAGRSLLAVPHQWESADIIRGYSSA